ncbi:MULTISPECIES: tRNA uridine-5-carboxymethylaminomethyl(34) synthesis GTPase MnmE [Clostridia]|uniref:tRNA uridine-5-carboxymethylaminomethyl(34) synthesis GTPase MnmE n=1 Tax=Clostridia TaxID=186801 RepID=UPI000EB43F7D|nr:MULTISPECIES: tRNA uridine-5-carboxymethylaminomethyl(34) synthesis GTPase MnmE [Clostridia]RKQ27401.1 tRNA uridine-5-carboxymethylaminomethyl(34) synthesis GTPase MnmE [Ruminococcus sp. B05]TAP30937.1 tRNA uridine-5-carboxymethylaminomethyl(34) synthesis GTPase MnmE [Mediterraneibacter sp. gm002]
MYSKETIAAISTGMSNSGIGIVRISGEEAFQVIDKIYKGKEVLSKVQSHTIHYGYIVDGKETIDEVLVSIMRAPRTFTGEDTVEINCHGGVYVVKRVLDTVLRNGARPAEPGEFTKRAFLNGKMDLSQAEAVIDVITAKNEYALKSSMSQLKGSVKKKIEEIRKQIIYHTAFIETALDDPEHISVDGYGEQLEDVVETLSEELKDLIDSSENGRIMKEGIQTVILGKPNAGKSSLLNVLSGRERAIVTDIEGTTRDVLEEQIQIQGLNLNVIDTAGIRETEDKVEKIGVDKAKEYAEQADLIIYVVDASRELDENDIEIMKIIAGKKAVILLNKMDLNVLISKENLEQQLQKEISGACENIPMIEISAKEEQGIRDFENLLKKMFLQGEISFNDEVYITNMRQKSALQDAYNSLKKVKESIEMGMPEDFYSIDLMDAYEALGSITGETIGEDLVNEIFSKFCMGK